jgi:hypothetical protein
VDGWADTGSSDNNDAAVGGDDEASVLKALRDGGGTETIGSSSLVEGDREAREAFVSNCSPDPSAILGTTVGAGFGLDDDPSVVSVGFAPFDDSERTFAFGRLTGTVELFTAAFVSKGEGDAAEAGRAAQCAVRGSAEAAMELVSHTASVKGA